MLRSFKRLIGRLAYCLIITHALGSTWVWGDEVDSLRSGEGASGEPTAEQSHFFETSVRPLLAKRCYECHSGQAKTLMGGLRLDGRGHAVGGGDSGPAIVPGKPDDSLLMESIRWESYEMPPKGKLPDSEVATLAKWIEMGAPWPNDVARTTEADDQDPDNYDWRALQAEHWAFRPVVKPEPPSVANGAWGKSDLDRFVLARLERAGLEPSPPAEPRVLVRRIYYDLIGLPPSPEQFAAFHAAWEEDPDIAVRELVDELLASPHYGERWGRHWLDVARYSDGQGGFLDSAALPHAWRYRDWVVAALNRDMPFDQFVKQQIAGDLLVDGHEGRVATGLFALGPTYKSDGGDPDSVAQAKSETLDDRVDTLTRGLLGLTVSCARCHDHKFDPIPQQDYYALAGVFNNSRGEVLPAAPAGLVQAYNEQQNEINKRQQRINEERSRIKKEKREPSNEEAAQLAAWQAEVEGLKKALPSKFPEVHALIEAGSSDMRVAIRGDLRKPGEVAQRRLPRIVAGEGSPLFTQGSGRLQLAEAMTSMDNPLVPRVFVNRVWMHHFGRALVRTPSNFGKLGEEPTHPQLLDWLASEFVAGDWSIKQLHRTIMNSATYRMSSRFDENAYRVDGDNRLLWRMNPRRQGAESWRDTLLSVTGELDRTIGGEPTEDVHSLRRTLYFKVSRNGDRFASDEFLRLFDFPLMRATVSKRPTSIVPQQFLFLMNSRFMNDRANALAERLERECDGEADKIERAYRLLHGRIPTEAERQVGSDFLRAVTKEQGEHSAWRQYAQILLSSNELMFVR